MMNQFLPTQKTLKPARLSALFLSIWLCGLPSIPADALSLQIIEDRVWIDVQNEPLQSVLQAFADRGVQVRMGPGIQAKVSGSLEDVDLEAALEDLLGPYNYILNWKMTPTPEGSLVILNEIQVFRPGQKNQAARSLPEKALRVINQHPDGYAYVKDEILIGLKPGSDVNDLKQILMHVGGTIVKSLNPPGIYVVRLGENANAPALVESLLNHESIQHAELNLAYSPVAPTPNAENSTVGTQESHSPSTIHPDASAVAILDSGLQLLPELEGRIGASLDATNPENAMSDESGHGTQMALIASGLVTPNGAGTLSQAPPIIPIRTFQADGYASSSDLMTALQFAVQEGASVVNMSWGSSVDSDFLRNTLRSANASGLIFIASAGNTPNGEKVFPAANEEVLAVGAIGSDGELWPSSNFGDFIAFTAPGSADLPIGHEGPPGSYAGTSIASAYASAVLSTYRANNPTLSREQSVKNFLDALTDAGPAGKDSRYGAGVLDEAALKRLGLARD